MIHKRVDKVKNQDGMYLVFDTRTFEPVFLTNIDNSNIIMDTVAMNAGFQGIELKEDDKFYYVSQLFRVHQEHDKDRFVNLVTFAKTMKSTNLAQVTLDYLHALRNDPIINVDEAFFAFIGTDTIPDVNYIDPKVRVNMHTW